MNEKYIIRQEQKEDYDTIHTLVEIAFSKANLTALNAVKSSKATRTSSSNTAETIEATYVGDFALFNTSLFPIAFRLTMTEGYLDIDLKTSNSQVMDQSFQLLLAEVAK